MIATVQISLEQAKYLNDCLHSTNRVEDAELIFSMTVPFINEPHESRNLGQFHAVVSVINGDDHAGPYVSVVVVRYTESCNYGCGVDDVAENEATDYLCGEHALRVDAYPFHVSVKIGDDGDDQALLTEEEKAWYMDGHTDRCPRCHGSACEYGDLESESDAKWQEATCEDCGLVWHDCYTLTSVEDKP